VSPNQRFQGGGNTSSKEYHRQPHSQKTIFIFTAPKEENDTHFQKIKDMQGFFNIIVHCSKLKKHKY